MATPQENDEDPFPDDARDKDKQALKAAEDHVVGIYTSIHRSVAEQWGFDDEDLAKIEYNKNGYLACGIQSSRILEHAIDDDGEERYIEVVPDVGFPLDPEEYRVYQTKDGDWIVETH